MPCRGGTRLGLEPGPAAPRGCQRWTSGDAHRPSSDLVNKVMELQLTCAGDAGGFAAVVCSKLALSDTNKQMTETEENKRIRHEGHEDVV